MNSQLSTLHTLTTQLSAGGNRTAILTMRPDGQDEWSYRRLGETVHELASGLAQRGVGPGKRVALLAENRPEWIASCLAVLQAGATVMPLDVQLGEETLTHILNDSGAAYVFTSTEQVERLNGLELTSVPKTILFDAPAGNESGYLKLLGAADTAMPEPRPEDPAALFYTSGTTGPPKGVPLSHANLAFQVNTVREANLVTAEDRLLLPLPLHHVYPFVIGMLVPLGLHLPIVLPASLTGPQILRAIREGEVTAVIGVPRLYRALYSGIESQAAGQGRSARMLFQAAVGLSTWLRRRLGVRVGKRLLQPLHRQFGPTLRMLASGGSALDPELGWRLEGLGWQVAIGYGLTETAPLLTINPPGAGRLHSVGQPVKGVEIKIDPAAHPDQSSSPEDSSHQTETGEILARGPNVFSGYRNLPDKTAEALTEDGWFRTGDLGYLDNERYLYIQGRVSTLIITESGKNIQPDEVEELYAAHPLIREIGILQHQGRLGAVIIPDLTEIKKAGAEDIEEAIRRAVTERSRKLPSYKRLEDYAISRDALPRTRLGKIRRHLLTARYEQAKAGKEDGAQTAVGPVSLQEMSDHDRSLLDVPAAKLVWDWLAGRYPDVRLTPDTSPQLDLGIDSLEWLNLTMEIGQRTGVELTDAAIGRIETVRDLLQEVAEQAGQGEAASPTKPLEHPEEVISQEQKRWLQPLSPLQLAMAKGLYLLNKLIMRSVFRVQAKGIDHVLHSEQFVLTPNHVSLLDPFAIAAVLPFSLLRRTFFAGWTGMAFRNAFFRFVSRLAQVVPIDPERAVSSSLAFGAAVVKRGNNLIWFPEGERSRSGELQAFKPGIGMLLDHYPVAVIPAFIQGAYQALPRGRVWPTFTRITIDFGKPLEPRQLDRQGGGDQPQDRISQGLFEQVAALRDNRL